jgi:acyl-coenzyme A synthetase/AMP-(fatty) acid ligase/acyl carrier protein
MESDSYNQARPRHVLSTVSHLLAETMRSRPHAVAILAPNRAGLTYGELGHQLETTQRALAEAGYGRGSRIAIALPESPELAVALLAVCSATTCAPLNAMLNENALLHLLLAMGIDALIALDDADSAPAHAARKAGVALLKLQFSPQDPAGVFVLSAEQPLAPVAVQFPGVNDIAIVAHTSGTTSAPKIAPYEQWRLAEAARNRIELDQTTATDRCLLLGPLYSLGAVRRGLLPPLLAGGSVVCPIARDGKALVDVLEADAPTYYVAAPATQIALLEEFTRRIPRPKHSLRFIASTSAELVSPLRRRLEETFGVPVIETYGMTETGNIAQTQFPPVQTPAGSVGRPTFSEVAVTDESGRFLPAGETGEVVVRGAEVFGGYEYNNDANRAAFRGGWFRTGDAGRIDRNGFVFLDGRTKDIINRGGMKIAPGQVEAALARNPHVHESAAFGIPHPTLGEDVAAAVVLRESERVSPDELRRFARTHLAPFMVPSRIIFVRELPRGSLGKVRRSELLKTAQRVEAAEFEPPRNRDETEVARIFADVLGVPGVSRADNFFHLGGDSLRGMRVLASVEEVFGVTTTLDLLFDHPEVGGFAAAIRALYSPQESGGGCRAGDD